ncbi:MAG TPA: hypothetical protein VMR50_04555 [Myxococcota bacterium]|nr:hypothetical protein [Myxococcota bacterium]
MTRPRASILAVIACAAAGFFAGSARAGEVIQNPHDIDSCGTPNIASEMTDPNNTVSFSLAGPQDCVKLCKQAEKECKSFVKRVSTCRQDYIKDQESYDKSTCDAVFNGSDVRDCKRTASDTEKNSLDNEKAQVKVYQAACEAWENVCANRCNPPG